MANACKYIELKLGFTGEIILKFSGIQELTMRLGTYKTFKIDISTDNLTITMNQPTYKAAILH